MQLGGMGMDMGIGIGVGASPPTTTSTANPKKKRRTRANKAQAAAQRAPTIQDYVPPPLSGFGDTVVASNPFDDTSPAGLNTGMHNGAQQMLPHHPHHMRNPQLQGVNPLATGNMNLMMPHMDAVVNSMNNTGMGNRMGHMGNMPNANLPPVNSMNPMNNMCLNMPQCNMPPMNNIIHMGMNHMMNLPMSGPLLNSPMNGMNHNLGSPMGDPIGLPINNMISNRMASSTMSVSGINPANAGLPYNAPQPHPYHLNNIRKNRPHNMTPMNPTVPNPRLGNNQMNNLKKIKLQINNMQNVNMNQCNQMGHMDNPMGNVPNNLSGKSPSYGMNMSNAMPQHGLQAPPLGPRPIPESTGKVYPPDQPVVFNHQDPNALPILPCGVCHKEVHVNDQAILCESGCNFLFHRQCTGLTKVAFELLMNEVCAEWACDRCMSSKNVSLVKFKP